MPPYNDDYETKMAAQATGCVIALLWAAIAAPIALIWKSARKPIEEKTLRAKPRVFFDYSIRGFRCFNCGAINEEGKWYCSQCGREFPSS